MKLIDWKAFQAQLKIQKINLPIHYQTHSVLWHTTMGLCQSVKPFSNLEEPK